MPPVASALKFENIELDLSESLVFVDGVRLAMPPLQIALLRELMLAWPNSISIATLMDRLWTNVNAGPEAVSAALSRLRSLIGPAAAGAIVTVRGSRSRAGRYYISTNVLESKRRASCEELAVVQQAVHTESSAAGFLRELIDASRQLGLDSRQAASTMDLMRVMAKRLRDQVGEDHEAEGSIGLHLSAGLLTLGDTPGALIELRKTIEVVAGSSRPNDPVLLMTRLTLAREAAVASLLPEAEWQLEAAEIQLRAPGTTISADLAFARSAAWFAVYVMKVHLTDADKLGENMVKLADAVAPPGHHIRFSARFWLSDVKYRIGEFFAAKMLLDEILAPPYSNSNVGVNNLTRARGLMARVLAATGEHDKAELEFLATIEYIERRLGRSDPFFGVVTCELGALYMRRGQFDLAARYYTDALIGFITAFKNELHQSALICSVNVAIGLLYSGDVEVALARLDRARPDLLVQFGSADCPVVQALDFYRASALTTIGRPGAALAELARLRHESLAQAEPATDWLWRLEAERARASIAIGEVASGKSRLQASVSQMIACRSWPWLIDRYSKLLAAL